MCLIVSIELTFIRIKVKKDDSVKSNEIVWFNLNGTDGQRYIRLQSLTMH